MKTCKSTEQKNIKYDDIKITVLTATLNVENVIRPLIQSLVGQTDRNFNWVVVDGCSNDSTVALISEAHELDVTILKVQDFGIYDALNRGVALIEYGYYLVVGADDTLAADAIKNYRASAFFGNTDIVCAAIIRGNRKVLPRRRFGWLLGMNGVASSHSVGMAINVDLHKKFGMYSNKFPIAADQLFVRACIAGGVTWGCPKHNGKGNGL